MRGGPLRDLSATPGLTGFAETARLLLDELDRRSGAAIAEAADLVLTCVEDGGLLHVAGAGHSLAMVCETFYRAGGLACVRPVWDERLLPLRDARESTVAEREAGFAATVLRRYQPAAPDVAVVFSTTGTNPYPVELAAGCVERGVPVVAFTSVAASDASAQRSSGRLHDIASVTVDTCVPPGDAVHPTAAPRTAGVSTFLATYAWSRLLAELDARAAEAGLALPRWTSANVPQGDEANDVALARFTGRVPELGAGHQPF